MAGMGVSYTDRLKKYLIIGLPRGRSENGSGEGKKILFSSAEIGKN